MADNNNFECILFDFDGTLSKTPLDFSLMRDNVYKAIAPVVPKSIVQSASIPSMPLMEEITALCSLLSSEIADSVYKLAYASIVQTEIEAAKKSTLFPSVREGLAAGKKKGITFGIVTRNCKEAVLTSFPDVTSYITTILTREDVPLPKPHPDHLQRAIDSIGTTPGKTLMVGDHKMDIEAGKAAGTSTAGISSGEMSFELLSASSPDILVRTFSELMHYLKII